MPARFLLFLTFLSSTALAQPFAWGLRASGGADAHATTTSAPSGGSTLPSGAGAFSDAIGWGASFGGHASTELWALTWTLGADLHLNGVDFTSRERLVVGVDGVPRTVGLSHAASYLIAALGTDLRASLPVGAWSVSLGLGARFGLAGSLRQSVTMDEWDRAVMPLGPNDQTVAEGAPNLKALLPEVLLSATGPGRRIGTWQARPTLELRRALGSVVAGGDPWALTSLRFGFSFAPSAAPVALARQARELRRDTLTRLVAPSGADRIVLESVDSVVALVDAVETTIVREHYVRELPRPRGLLVGSLRIRFLQDGKELPRAIVEGGVAPLVRFTPTAVSESGVNSWDLVLVCKGDTLLHERGFGEPRTIEWRETRAEVVPKLPGTRVDAILRLVDHDGTVDEGVRGSVVFERGQGRRR